MKKHILSLAVAVCLTTAYTSNAFASSDTSDTFYNRKSEGWFWYEPEPEPEQEIKVEPKKEPVKAPETKQEAEPKKEATENNEVVVNVAWLRENLPKLRDSAIDNPTYENVRRYFYAQRIMMDKSSKFASVAQQVSKFEVPLDETLRRPENQVALYDQKVTAKQNRSDLIKQLADKVGFFFFFSSTCTYCMKEAPMLQRLQAETGIDILAISLDGRPLPNNEFPDYVTDPGTLKQKLQVMVTPTIYLVTKDGSEFHNLAVGLTAPEELMRRTIMLASKEGWITGEQYDATQDVREILLDDATKSQLTVDPEKVFSDPDYLANKLRAKFQNQYDQTKNIQSINQDVTP
ncbi:conjugal transfer protein TraF [Vibrio vulnificus]|uniref:conjugal transfer protein TraF n=1 Tax=Vibrio vulnificus TaxID=672 RepID=UPI000CD2DAE2|nr:conjugal transfer protein TraF [Vibrio vulnificus]POC39282.1 conjugal transfer protein [Vibrio vulnificus]